MKLDIASGLRYCAMLSKARLTSKCCKRCDSSARISHWSSKIILTGLVVATTVGGYVMAPGAISPSVLALVSVGTALTSSAANSINQVGYSSKVPLSFEERLFCLSAVPGDSL